MKTLHVTLCILSACFIIFSLTFASKVNRARNGYPPDYAQIVRKTDALHHVIKPVSLVYFLGAFGVFAAGLKKSKTLSIIAATVALLMAGWSCLLSGAISFDEVYPAWMVAASVIGVLSFVVSRRKASDLRAA